MYLQGKGKEMNKKTFKKFKKSLDKPLKI